MLLVLLGVAPDYSDTTPLAHLPKRRGHICPTQEDWLEAALQAEGQNCNCSVEPLDRQHKNHAGLVLDVVDPNREAAASILGHVHGVHEAGGLDREIGLAESDASHVAGESCTPVLLVELFVGVAAVDHAVMRSLEQRVAALAAVATTVTEPKFRTGVTQTGRVVDRAEDCRRAEVVVLGFGRVVVRRQIHRTLRLSRRRRLRHSDGWRRIRLDDLPWQDIDDADAKHQCRNT